MSTLEFLKHFPYCARPEAATTERLCGFGTPGQTVAFSFSLRCTEDIAEIELSTPTLSSETATIKSSQIEIYVVKVWDVSGVGVFQSERMTQAELLLKDDRVLLDEGYFEHPQQGAGSIYPLWLYSAPNVRLTGDVHTSLSAGEQKQIWLSVKIPVDAPAMKYQGSLKVRTSQGDARQLPIELEVLPFRLMEPAQDLLIWYRGSMDLRQSQFYVSPEMFRIQLQDIYDHGFRSISVCERDRATAQLAVDIAEQVGFDRHIVFRLIPANAEALRFSKLKPVFYLSDELDVRMLTSDGLKESSIAEHRGHGAYCEILNWDSMASIVNHKFVERMADDQDVGYKPTIVSLSLAGNRDLIAGDDRAPMLTQCRTYYNWQSHMEKPNLHRVLAGCYLWKTGADGISPYCYQHAPVFPFSPFDDFDAWEPRCRTGAFRDHMTTYPAQTGVIPTLQWEGLREGIVDLHYLTTLEHLLSLVESLGSQEAKALATEARYRRDTFLNRIDIHDIAIESAVETEPYPHISPPEYQDFRRQIALDIGGLYAHVSGQPELLPNPR